MRLYLISFIVLASVFVLALILLHISTLRPIRAVLFHVAIGLLSLTLVNLCSLFGGVFIAINKYTLLISSVLGLPGVIGLLILNLII